MFKSYQRGHTYPLNSPCIHLIWNTCCSKSRVLPQTYMLVVVGFLIFTIFSVYTCLQLGFSNIIISLFIRSCFCYSFIVVTLLYPSQSLNWYYIWALTCYFSLKVCLHYDILEIMIWKIFQRMSVISNFIKYYCVINIWKYNCDSNILLRITIKLLRQ